jgi:hypothetical protein
MTITADELLITEALHRLPNGICDYSQPGIGQQPLLGTYLLVQYGYVMPFFGLELLDMARDVAAFNLPARVGQLFGVSL